MNGLCSDGSCIARCRNFTSMAAVLTAEVAKGANGVATSDSAVTAGDSPGYTAGREEFR